MIAPCLRTSSIGLLLTCATWCPAANPLYEALRSAGIEIAPNEVLRLPEPTLADGLTAAQQRQAIEALLGGRYSWGEFTRRAVVAPLLLKISDRANAESIGRRVDLWFVAYGDLRRLSQDAFLSEQFRLAEDDNANDRSVVKQLQETELSQRDLAPPTQAEDPRYVAAEITLLDRVRVSATTRSVKIETADSVLVASLLDPHFADDAQYPNRWRPITRDDQGRRHLGVPQPYTGLGSYAKATRLVEPSGALFLEYHVAFAEPNGWFQGANLLRSKLPIVAQDAVRSFRRSLEKP